MKILLHQCCGPCSIYPITQLKKQNAEIVSYFYNPNIHPVTEYYKRMEAAVIVNNAYDIKYIIDDEYGLIDFTRKNANNEKNRCAYCYKIRFFRVAEKAKELGFDYFTSSLLYSKMQNHELILNIANLAAEKFNIKFYYEDYREGWQDGIDISKQMEIYRQNYCGCIYSEEDRFLNQLSNKFSKKYQLSTYQK